MANCLAWSVNGAAWHLMAIIGVKRTIEFAQACGIKTKLPPYPSIALGAAEIPMLEMLQAYSMFPNNSFSIEPIMLSRIEDKSGNELEQFTAKSKQVMSEVSANIMVELMQGVVQFGTAHSLNNYNIPVQKAGKTGTTNDNADGWFIGYTPELLAGTWVGCEDPFIRIYSGTSGGNELALPKWGIFMSKVYADNKLGYGKIKEFPISENTKNQVSYADEDWSKLFNQGDSLGNDVGNGDADDFFNTPSDYNTPKKDEPGNKVPKAVMDSSKAKKPDDKKGTQPVKSKNDY